MSGGEKVNTRFLNPGLETFVFWVHLITIFSLVIWSLETQHAGQHREAPGTAAGLMLGPWTSLKCRLFAPRPSTDH